MRNGWRDGQLGDFFEIVTGGTPPKSKAQMYGNYMPLVKPPELLGGEVHDAEDSLSEEGAKASRALPVGSTLVSCIGILGKTGIAKVPLATNQQINAIRPNKNIALPEFVFYLVQSPSFVQQLGKLASGTTVQIVNKSKFKGIFISLPSLPEQKRIVSMLDEAFAGIDTAVANTKKNLANARELFETSLERIISSFTFTEMLLTDAVAEDCSLSYGIVQPGTEIENGMVVVRPVDLRQPTINAKGLKRIDPEKAKAYERTRLKGGELLLCVRGTTGTVAQASDELAGGNVTRGIVPIRFSEDTVDREFGYHLFRSAHVQSQIREKTYGAALMQINIRDLRKIKLHVPALERQKEMVVLLQEVEGELSKLQVNYQRKLAALAELKQSLMQKAFAGELTADVPKEMEAALA